MDEDFILPSGDEAPTIINAEIEGGRGLRKIVEAVDTVMGADSYPVIVEDGTLILDVNDNRRNRILGDLSGDVEGPEVENYYGEGFERAIKTIGDGPVQLQTGPEDELAINYLASSHMLRHVLSHRAHP